MREQKAEEVPVVVEADALVDPYTVVVELLNAGLANGAVLRPRWLLKSARATILFSLKDHFIKFEAFKS